MQEISKMKELYEVKIIDNDESQLIITKVEVFLINTKRIRLKRVYGILKEYILKSSQDINPNFEKDVDGWFNNTTHEQRLNDGGRFNVGNNFSVMEEIGLKKLPVLWGKSKMQKILDKHPEINICIIKKIPQVLKEPILIMDSVTRNDSLVFLGEIYSEEGIPIMLSLLVDPKTKAGIVQDFNIITSVYAKNNKDYQMLINRSTIRYIHKDKKRTNSWLQALGLQLPSAVTKYGSINKVTNEYINVNS